MSDSLHVCPHCNSIHRVRTAFLNAAPNCGKGRL